MGVYEYKVSYFQICISLYQQLKDGGCCAATSPRILHLAIEYARHRRRRRRLRCEIWLKLLIESRRQFGFYDQLMVELRNEDQRAFRNFLRMRPEMYDELMDNILDTGNPWSLIRELEGLTLYLRYHYQYLLNGRLAEEGEEEG